MGNVGGKAYHSSPGSNHVSRKELDRLQRRCISLEPVNCLKPDHLPFHTPECMLQKCGDKAQRP